MDSILIVYYSYTGVSRRAAQLLASHCGWPMGEIRDVHPRVGAMGGLRCVLDSLFARQPEIRYEGPDPADFRTVVLVSPVWSLRLAGPMRSFVAQNATRLGRVAQVTTMNSGGASNAIAEVARLLKHSPVRTAEFTSREIEDGSATTRLFGFGDAFFSSAADSLPPGHPGWKPLQPSPTSEGQR